MSTVIKVENLSKQYRLGDVGTGSIAHDVNRAWYKLRGKEDPYLKIGETNDRTKKGESDYVWALKDVNFEIKQGEVVGIIGRNGAGKSTLLKILSRTTTPTTGSVKIKGRVASLLEVGTGFHPELSGRENIFLNGAIMGMTKQEIKRKFDEIVDFAGVERYIDTPVKRYSSGMYVRLAFGVAAHLEPEILIIDEVLAVGDAEFQKKAMGKMKDVSEKEGRTVLFVSHNMGMINKLCNSAVVLKDGSTDFIGEVSAAITQYLEKNSSVKTLYEADKLKVKSNYIQKAFVADCNYLIKDKFNCNENIFIVITTQIKSYNSDIKLSVTLQNINSDYLSTIVEDINTYVQSSGEFSIIIKLPSNVLVPNSYFLRIALFTLSGIVSDLIEMVCPFTVIDSGSKLAFLEGTNYGLFNMDYKISEISNSLLYI